jgi:hypothetical protein
LVAGLAEAAERLKQAKRSRHRATRLLLDRSDDLIAKSHGYRRGWGGKIAASG